MEYPYLVYALVAQGVILLLLFGGLAWYQISGAVSSWRRRAERGRLREALERFADGRAPAGSVVEEVRTATLFSAAIFLKRQIPGLDDERRRELLRALRRSDWFDRVLEQSDSPLWWRRLTAAEILDHLATLEDTDVLEELLVDDHPAVSTAALLTIRRLRPDDLMEPLMDEAQIARDSPHWDLIMDVLAGYGDDLVPLLRYRLRKPADEDARVVQLRLAHHLQAPSLQGPVQELTRIAPLETRINAVRTLASWSDAAVVASLRQALEDPAWQVRVQAASGLGEIGAADAVPDLVDALSDPSWWVRLRSALALRRLGRAGEEALESLGPDDDPYARDMAEYVLGLDEAAVGAHAI